MSRNHQTTRARHDALADYRARCKAADLPCWICRQPIDYEAAWNDWSNRNRFERDHIKDADAYPELYDVESNWGPSHAGCNNAKRNKQVRPDLGEPSQAWT